MLSSSKLNSINIFCDFVKYGNSYFRPVKSTQKFAFRTLTIQFTNGVNWVWELFRIKLPRRSMIHSVLFFLNHSFQCFLKQDGNAIMKQCNYFCSHNIALPSIRCMKFVDKVQHFFISLIQFSFQGFFARLYKISFQIKIVYMEKKIIQ